MTFVLLSNSNGHKCNKGIYFLTHKNNKTFPALLLSISIWNCIAKVFFYLYRFLRITRQIQKTRLISYLMYIYKSSTTVLLPNVGPFYLSLLFRWVPCNCGLLWHHCQILNDTVKWKWCIYWCRCAAKNAAITLKVD